MAQNQRFIGCQKAHTSKLYRIYIHLFRVYNRSMLEKGSGRGLESVVKTAIISAAAAGYIGLKHLTQAGLEYRTQEPANFDPKRFGNYQDQIDFRKMMGGN